MSCPCTCHTGSERLEDALRTTLAEAEITSGTRAASTDAGAGALRVGTLRGLLPCPFAGESRPGDEPGRWDRERALKSRGDEEGP